MRFVFASEDLISNLGVSCLIFGILLLLGNLLYEDLLIPGLLLLIVGGAIYWVRNKEETEH